MSDPADQPAPIPNLAAQRAKTDLAFYSGDDINLLDIWADNKHKVFSLRWTDARLIRAVRFNRGDREDALMS